MRLELRYTGEKVRGLCLIAESEKESIMIDKTVGDIVKDDGLIAVVNNVEVRISDGYAEHYIYIPAVEPEQKAGD